VTALTGLVVPLVIVELLCRRRLMTNLR